MWGSPEGYGSISRTYEVGASSSSASFETCQVRSSAQTCCHLRSIAFGSYDATRAGYIRPVDVQVHQARVRDRVEIAYVREGVGGFPLLLLHGWPETKRIWWRNVEPLVAAGFEVIVPDLAGFGDSGLADDDHYDVGAHALDLHALVSDVLGHDAVRDRRRRPGRARALRPVAAVRGVRRAAGAVQHGAADPAGRLRGRRHRRARSRAR